MNKVFLHGNLGQDVELKHTPNGNVVANLSVCVSVKKGDSYETEWFRVTAWGKTAELAAQYLQKGSGVIVEGRLSNRTWDKDGVKQYATDIVAERIEFTARKNGDNCKQETKAEKSYTTDDIPF